MEKTTYNMQKGFLLKREELLNRIKEIEKYYNKETIEYLISLVMLEQPIFKDIEFGELFGKTDLFYQIAKYNLCNRTIETIENIKEIDQKKLSANYFIENLSINYSKSKDESFNVFTSELGRNIPSSDIPRKPSLSVYEIISPVEKQIETCERKIASLSNASYRSDDQLSGYDVNNKPVFSPVYGGPNSQKYFANQSTKDALKADIESLKKCGTIKTQVTNLVSKALLADWEIEENDEKFPFDKKLILELSWIDVYKIKR